MFLLHMSLQFILYDLDTADLAGDPHLTPVRLDHVLVEEVPGQVSGYVGALVTSVHQVRDSEELLPEGFQIILVSFVLVLLEELGGAPGLGVT